MGGFSLQMSLIQRNNVNKFPLTLTNNHIPQTNENAHFKNARTCDTGA